MPDKVYRTAIYCRLSREDGDKVESNSIASQRAICEDYIARHEDLELVCEPFVDDGYSGVSFNRPQFKKLEEAIRKGALDCIVVKDLSRFSRNYIDGGRYIEKIFPQLGIRFIAINDAYDSLTGDPQSDSFVIPFKNLINDSYCKDISMKIRSSLEVKQKSGEFVGSFAPYGYMKSPENKNQLIVDEAVSEYVQMIFSMYKDGFSIGRIAKRLNQMGVLSPMEYKHSAGVKFDTVFKTGDIISKEDFELAQKVIRGGGRNPTRKQHDYPLKGLVRCGNCKRAMTRRKNKAGIRYFQCIHSVNNGNTDCPVGRSFPEMDIEKVVFHALTQFLALAQKEAIQNREVGDLRKSAIKECADKIRTLQKQNEQNKASKLRLYEKYAAGSITKEAYIQQKAAADVKIAENDGAIQRSHERMKELDSETACSDEKLDAVCEQYADCKALTYELTHAFISAVYIYDLDNIEIVWKFKDFLTTSEGEAK